MGERRRAWESGSFEKHSGGSESRELAGEVECRGQIFGGVKKLSYRSTRVEGRDFGGS